MLHKHIKKIIALAAITITITATAIIHNYNYRNITLHEDDITYISDNQLVISNTKNKNIKIIRKLHGKDKVTVLKNNIKIQEYPSSAKADLIFYNYNNLKLEISR
ncbi:hypothetical protein CPAST_c35000 [Clostridium pasteurianum DSM 525 = ATCC 6013]|uniref:Uncharacterized protein n=1 Tax=Clostridium pasteurianum DSM 525 = ATCC 6013 TaxID=1262449 RepID=A0A0H3J6C8_CLOPA|nr:hypothetical protein [Clostridium pasteurianum]AJA49561.1 hypothetical protein CPAST_c35000 [Clostridium pasteurianum DSM 525 = ATCC 6013]AJA53549.1 hypothetical protein CLPA_c35000 [Clostridium pasteurianum DSM 525 = ATCC 6013]AOZ76715.1 hypothetical protein AQ983_16995 [Clostridium pasteurianum DSM 525 = ATCC 6013]AOZ80512.1 hypothetical protein AQ984_16990 [Clostridium pasteurianum]ELP58923.1 hypothetical protein F502_12381 [Clostridium pasteurianum DSM 525 = ATCC 6013]